MHNIDHLTAPVADLTRRDRAEMLGLMQTYYLGVTQEDFDADLAEKEHVILLRPGGGGGRIVGFSTLVRLDLRVGAESVKAVFSGDTVVERENRATLGLGVEIAAYFARTLQEFPGIETYYVLIAKGWQTCRIPALLFREFSPAPDQPVILRHQQVMDAFGARKYPQNYDPEAGLIVYSGEAQRVMPGSPEGEIPCRNDPQVNLFLKKNPHYLRGDELVYVAPIAPDNFSKTFLRLRSASRKETLVG